MCIKKTVLILLLLGISFLSLSSQSAIAEDNEGDVTIAEMRKSIEENRINEVNELLNQSKINEIEQLFSQDEEAYFALIKENDLTYANFLRGMMFKAYRNVASLQDDLLFIDCKSATYSQEWDKVALRANDLLRRHPESNRKTVALRYWKLALLKLGKDQEYVNLVEQYPEFELAVQKYQYGQSLYNIGRYDEAQQYLEEAALDDNYTLRASATLALTALAKGNIDEAVSIFDILQKNFSPESPYYDFILLSIARLFSHFGDPDTALSYYQDYSRLNNNDIGEVIYEVAIAYRKAGNLEKAQKSFERILETKFADEYYVQALYNLILIDQELNDGQATTTILTNYQARIDDYFESLLKNRNLITEIRNLRDNFLMETEQSKKGILQEQIKAKEQEVINNQIALKEKISYLDANTIQVIERLEQEYIIRTENYFAELDLIDKYRNTPKDNLIAMVNADRINKEFDYILAITEDLLSDIPNPTNNQGERALWYANQLYLKKKYIVNLSKLVDKSKSVPAKNAQYKNLLAEELENLDEIRVKAKFDLAEFPNLAEKQELADQQVEEFLAQERKVEEKRKLVIDTYYEKKADKLQRDVVTRFNELDESNEAYTAAFTKFNNIKNEQGNYIDFIELDLEYRKLTESYKQRYEQTKRDGIAIPEDEFQQIVNEREDLYKRINNFVFRNNQFKNNDKLYFNMAELAFIIYNNNHNLIYNNYKKVLELNPDYPQKDVVIYNLAYYENQILDSEIADIKDELMKDVNYFINQKPESVIKNTDKYKEVIGHYLELMKDSNSDYQIPAMLNLAKLFFDIAVDAQDKVLYIDKSIKLYSQVIILGNEVQQRNALFQRAWHKMSIGRYIEAIQDLEILLAQRDKFSENEEIIYDNFSEIAAYSLNSLDLQENPEYTSFQYVSNDLFNKFNDESATDIFNKLITRKKLFDRYYDIINLYHAKSSVRPMALENPTYLDSVMLAISSLSYQTSKDSLDTLIKDEYYRVYQNYGYNSEWYNFNKDNDIAPYVKNVQKVLDDRIIPDYFQIMKQNPTLENINEFSRVVNEYANYNGFNEDIRKEKLVLYDGNTINNLITYVSANPDTTSYNLGIREVYNYIDRNPDYEERRVLEQNAYSWSLSNTVLVDSMKFDSLQYSIEDQEIIKNQAREKYLQIADRFYNYIATSDFADKDEILHSLLYYRGIRKMKIGDNEGAREDFLACDSLDISDEFKENIYRSLAEIYIEKNDNNIAIEYYKRAKQFADADTKKLYDDAIYNARLSNLNQFESSQSQEDKIKAAQEMALIIGLTDDTAEKPLLKKKEIALYLDGGDYNTALDKMVAEGDKAQDLDSAWEFYGNAIAISDSLKLTDRKLQIEDGFMERFPYDKITLDILTSRIIAISDSTTTNYNPSVASEKLMEIYDRATKDGEKLDISGGPNSLEDYYFNSVEMKCRVITKAEQVEEWVNFYQKFPDYQTIGVLTLICQLYEELEQDEKYLEYIKILYSVDNSNPLYPLYASEKLMEINKRIYRAFREQNWEPMLKGISDFEALADEYTADGIPADDISINSLKNDYARYTSAYERYQEKQDLLASLESNYAEFMSFIEVSPNTDARVKVNYATDWDRNLDGENGRIRKLYDLTLQQYSLIDQESQKIANNDLLEPDEINEQLFLLYYAKFRISQYVTDTIFNQINRYFALKGGQYEEYVNRIAKRQDLSEEQMIQLVTEYNNKIRGVQRSYSSDFASATTTLAREIYNEYINGFTEQLPKSDEIISFMEKSQAYEVNPKDEIFMPFEPGMRRDFSSITESSYNDGYRDFVMYNIPGGDSLLIETDINCPILPASSRFRFLDEGDFWMSDGVELSIEFNNNPLDLLTGLKYDGSIEDSLATYQILNRRLYNDNNGLTNNLYKGNNMLTLKIVNNSLQQKNIGINFSVIYDQEELYIYNNSTFISVISDNSWLATDSLVSQDASDPSWQTVTYGYIEDDYSALNVFKNSLALPIWLNKESTEAESNLVITDTLNITATEVDSLGQLLTNTDTLDTTSELIEDEIPVVITYFIKEFDVSGEVLESTLNFLAKQTSNVYLNGEQVVYEEDYFIEAPDFWPEADIDPEYFVQGKNVLIFEILGPATKNGLLVDMKIQTLNQRR